MGETVEDATRLVAEGEALSVDDIPYAAQVLANAELGSEFAVGTASS